IVRNRLSSRLSRSALFLESVQARDGHEYPRIPQAESDSANPSLGGRTMNVIHRRNGLIFRALVAVIWLIATGCTDNAMVAPDRQVHAPTAQTEGPTRTFGIIYPMANSFYEMITH